MNKHITDVQYKIERANEKDWNTILQVLQSEDLTLWFTGKESYKDFYVVRNLFDREVICCFAIDRNNSIGILKSFAVVKKLQGKGIGRKIANMIPNMCEELRLKRLYAVTINTPGFWNKTFFREINLIEVKDGFLLQYLCNFVDKVDQYLRKIHIFLMR